MIILFNKKPFFIVVFSVELYAYNPHVELTAV
jgi:hypothetical protein